MEFGVLQNVPREETCLCRHEIAAAPSRRDSEGIDPARILCPPVGKLCRMGRIAELRFDQNWLRER
jgi:hypothetical protein